jgi:hypothetical protein
LILLHLLVTCCTFLLHIRLLRGRIVSRSRKIPRCRRAKSFNDTARGIYATERTASRYADDSRRSMTVSELCGVCDRWPTKSLRR